MAENNYSIPDFDTERLAMKGHRSVIGGRWDEIGKLQFDYMRNKGLKANHSLVDIGCGSFRGGVHFIDYLNPHNYFGFDLNRSLIDAGLEHEISPLGLLHKVKQNHMFAAKDFAFPQSWQDINYAIALSLFTHLTLNTIILCLTQLRNILAPNAQLHATIFLVDSAVQWKAAEQFDGVTTYPAQDPYHYSYEDMLFAAKKCGFTLKTIEDFNHPRNQKMAVFEKC